MQQETVRFETKEMTYREAVREALRDAMKRDERVFLMGEDVDDMAAVTQ
jgi:pyruvate/2-oxoglutarate/acetoin dehydrogenase E1 component